MIYHGRNMLVSGMLLHFEISTLFEFCHKLVRRACYIKIFLKDFKKKGGGGGGGCALILDTRVKTATPRPELKTAANMHHRCRYFFIDNVAFAKENTNEIYEAIKYLSLAAPKIASLATDTKKQKQQANRKLLTRSTFCNINTQGGSKDVIQARQQRPESPAVTHLTCV